MKTKTGDIMLWLWIPVTVILMLISCELFLPPSAIGYIVQENGPLELLQFAVLCMALVYALACLHAAMKDKQKWLSVFYGLAALGCFYIGGEEISWGQQFFKWATPELWLAVNDQQETNLHNTTSWLDQKPRLLIELGVVFGGLVLPLLLRYCGGIIPSWLKTIAPPGRMAVIAGIFLVVKILDKTGDISDFVFFKRGSEIIEIYIYYFILVYLYYMLRRSRKDYL